MHDNLPEEHARQTGAAQWLVPIATPPDPQDGLFATEGATATGPGGRPFPWRAMLRYKRTIAVGLLLVTLPAIIAIWWLVEPKYRARATVEVSPTNPRILYKTEDNGLIPMYQQYLNSQVGIIVSNKVLQRVVERKDVQETAWYRTPVWQPVGTAHSPLERLCEVLEVQPRGRTFLIDIDFTTSVPRDARIIVDAVLEEYREETHSRVEDTDVLVLGTLEQTLNDLNASITGRERIVEELRKELGTNLPQELLAQKRLRLDQLTATIQDIGRELGLVEWKRERLTQAMAQTVLTADDSVATSQPVESEEVVTRRRFESDTEWWRLYLLLNETELRLKSESERLGNEHPTIVRLAEEARHVEQRLHIRETRLLEMVSGRVEVALEEPPDDLITEATLSERIAALQKEKQLLTEALSEQQRSFAVECDKAGQFEKEYEELRKQKVKADFVRTRLDEKEMERGPVALMRVVSRPMTPSHPYRDRRLVWSGFALVAGLAGGLALACARGLLNQTIHCVDQITANTRTPFLGSLPLLELPADRARTSGGTEHEPYRMLRTTLLNSLDGHKGRVALVTSGAAGVGKTTVAVMLAESLARCGKRVLLIDADVRAPGVTQLLGIRPAPGLVDMLAGEADDATAIVSLDTPGLDVLPTGHTQGAHDAELLANGVFGSCLKRWRECYDVVLLDGPPTLPVADARILSRYVDGTIVVVREGHCRQPDVLEALVQLCSSGGRLLGTVYIGTHANSRYYNYSYSAYSRAASRTGGGVPG